MRVSVKSDVHDSDWHPEGICIKYKSSRLNKTELARQYGTKYYYEMSFTYDFRQKNDTVYFAYCIPYTFSKL